jgi:outer membrane protein assembly factor BamB
MTASRAPNANPLPSPRRSGGNVYGLDAATGTKVWRFAARASVVSSPAVANGMVYVGSNDGRLLAFALP